MRIVTTNSCENCPHFRDGSVVGINSSCSFEGDSNLRTLFFIHKIPDWCPMPKSVPVSVYHSQC